MGDWGSAGFVPLLSSVWNQYVTDGRLDNSTTHVVESFPVINSPEIPISGSIMEELVAADAIPQILVSSTDTSSSTTADLAAPKTGASLSTPPDSPATTDVNCPFPDTASPPQASPCSYNTCLSGHIWPAVLAVTRCPGCTGGVVAVQKVNCPFCNEPIVQTTLRSDFVPRGGGVVARCAGLVGPGESLDIEIKRNEWQQVEGTTRTFLEQEEIDRAAKA